MNPTDLQSDRVKSFVAPVIPLSTVGVVIVMAVMWGANWFRDRPNLDKITVVLAIETVVLVLTARWLQMVSQRGEVEATGIGLIWAMFILSSGLCLVSNFNGNGALQSMPFCAMLPLLGAFFWPRTWHFAVGTFAALAPPLVQLFVTDHTSEERLIFRQVAAVAFLLSLLFFVRVRRANERIAQLAAEIRYRATYDGLTGLLNRSHWFECVQQHQADTQSVDAQPASLLFLDVDDFKVHNDRSGHDVGDELLRGVAEILSRESAPDDLLGRFGGDEFVAYLPRTSRTEAEDYGRRVERAAAHLRTPVGSLAISIGIAEVQLGESLDQLIKRADTAMFHAKAAARARAPLPAE